MSEPLIATDPLTYEDVEAMPHSEWHNLPDAVWHAYEAERVRREHEAFIATYKGHFWVNVYEVDRQYGGPEEGGWWYDTGTPVQSHLCLTWESANEMRQVLATRFPRTDKRYSVLGGEDYSIAIEPHFAKPYPESRPYYE